MSSEIKKDLSNAASHSRLVAPAEIRQSEEELADAASRHFREKPELDVVAFGMAVHTKLKDHVVGYLFQVRKSGRVVYTAAWNWAQTPTDGGVGWTEDTRMHVASVSKFLTAVAMVKLFSANNPPVPYDAKIIDYLPSHWSKGPLVDQITFRQLFRHESGFRTKLSDYQSMRNQIADGVNTDDLGNYCYRDVNFGLCRILMPIINNDVDKAAVFSQSDVQENDGTWDSVTRDHYRSYMRANIFSPAEVQDADWVPSPLRSRALAYRFPDNGQAGLDSGDLGSVVGPVGWRLSARELLDVMDAVKRKNTIVTGEQAAQMLSGSFGLDPYTNEISLGGRSVCKAGFWRKSGAQEQCVAYFLPDSVEAVAFVSSRIGGYSKEVHVWEVVRDAYKSSLS